MVSRIFPLLYRSPQVYPLEYPSFEMSETNDKKSPGCSLFQASEMENRTTKLQESSFPAEMQSRLCQAMLLPSIQSSELPSTDISTPLQTLKRDEREGMTIFTIGNEEASIMKQMKKKKKIIEGASADWLPKDEWRMETTVRESGSTAGLKDKYYVHILTGTRCRSKPEVEAFMETGKKQKPKSKLPGSGKNEAQSAAQQFGKTLSLSIPDLNSSPERVSSDLNPELRYVNCQRKTNVKRKQHSTSDGQKQGQEDSDNLASKMCGLDKSGNAVKRRKMAHPTAGKDLDYSLTSSFTPASQGRPHASEQNGKNPSKFDGSVSTCEPVFPVTRISGKGPENTAPKPSETGSKASEEQCTEQGMEPLVPHRSSRGRPRGSKNVKVKAEEMKRLLSVELGRRLCKQFLGIAPIPSHAKSVSETTS